MKSKLICFLMMLSLLSCNESKQKIKQTYLAINSLSYTDVKYFSDKDEVFVSTYNGSVYKVNRNGNKLLMLQIEDEIYSIQYSEIKNIL